MLRYQSSKHIDEFKAVVHKEYGRLTSTYAKDLRDVEVLHLPMWDGLLIKLYQYTWDQDLEPEEIFFNVLVLVDELDALGYLRAAPHGPVKQK